MRYAHPETFLPLKILMMNHCQHMIVNIWVLWWWIFITVTIWFIQELTVFYLSRPFIFLFRRVLPFIFLTIFIFSLHIVIEWRGFWWNLLNLSNLRFIPHNNNAKIKGTVYLISLITNFPGFHLFIFVLFELRANWKEDCETLTEWNIRYYIGWDFTEWNSFFPYNVSFVVTKINIFHSCRTHVELVSRSCRSCLARVL